jgi:hypothetical protein
MTDTHNQIIDISQSGRIRPMVSLLMTYDKTFSRKRTAFLFLLLCMVLSGCYSAKWINHRFIPYKRPVFCPIRTDGYYYSIDRGPGWTFADRYFLFPNGKALRCGTINLADLTAEESKFTTGYFEQLLSAKVTADYTNFMITSDSIAFETVGIWQGYPHLFIPGESSMIQPS